MYLDVFIFVFFVDRLKVGTFNSSHDNAIGCFFFGLATIDIYIGTMAKIGPKAEGEP